jgi:hypothetical protein
LRIFESLQLWDRVVTCYKSLDKLELAESLIRRLIAERNDPIDHCLLGDITINPDHYHKAVEVGLRVVVSRC